MTHRYPSFQALSQLLKNLTPDIRVKTQGKVVGVLWLLLSDDTVEIIDIRVGEAYQRQNVSLLLETVTPNLLTQERTDIS